MDLQSQRSKMDVVTTWKIPSGMVFLEWSHGNHVDQPLGIDYGFWCFFPGVKMNGGRDWQDFAGVLREKCIVKWSST